MNVESQEYRPVLELYQGPCLLKHPVYALMQCIRVFLCLILKPGGTASRRG